MDTKISHAELWLSCCFNFTAIARKPERRKTEIFDLHFDRRLTEFALLYFRGHLGIFLRYGIEADLVEGMVAPPGQLFFSTKPTEALAA
jgi:hypothetical protein